MPAGSRAERYTSKAAINSLGLVKNIAKIKAAARKTTRIFDVEECETRILKKAQVIPHQHDFLTSWDTRYIGISGGFGCGKTFVTCAKQLLFCFRSQGYDHIFFEPSIPLLDDIAIPQFDSLLEELQIPHEFRRSPRPFYTLFLPKGDTRILLRSLENYEKIIGVNAASCVMDEIDTVRAAIVEKAIINIQGRARVGTCKQQFAFGSTPEGFNFMYSFFIVNEGEDRKLVYGKSEDNPFVRKDYIDDLRAQYPPHIAQAYLTGQFVNLQTATVFSEYDKEKNSSTVFEPTLEDIILFGADFNVGKSKSVYGVMRNGPYGQELHIFEEKTCRDTYDLASHIQKRFERHLYAGKVVCYPDATGKREYTTSTESDHDILRNIGVKVLTESRNPPIPSIIAHANHCLHKGTVLINQAKCPELDKCCIQWGYDKTLKPEKGGTIDHSNVGDAFKYLVWGAMPRASNRVSMGRRWR